MCQGKEPAANCVILCLLETDRVSGDYGVHWLHRKHKILQALFIKNKHKLYHVSLGTFLIL